MADQKPQQITGYSQGTTEAIISTCLHLATRLGDFLNDLVIIGGMVPYLQIDQTTKTYDERHCGSMDADLVLSVGLMSDERYEAIAERLFSAGFRPELNQNSNPSFQRWRHKDNDKAVVDFLIDIDGEAGKIQHLTGELAAFISPGVSLAFRDRTLRRIKGQTLEGANAEREFFVCGAGAFVILKARAFHSRGEPKDAYDIHYMLQYYGNGLHDIANTIRALADNDIVKDGLEKLKTEFSSLDSTGPIQLAKFYGRDDDEELRADCSGLVMQLVKLCKYPGNRA